MHIFKKTITIFSICIFLNACAESSKDIVGTYVSPLQFADYACPQLKSEMVRVSSKVKALTGKIDTNNENDKMITGAGMILFWPALFFIGALTIIGFLSFLLVVGKVKRIELKDDSNIENIEL